MRPHTVACRNTTHVLVPVNDHGTLKARRCGGPWHRRLLLFRVKSGGAGPLPIPVHPSRLSSPTPLLCPNPIPASCVLPTGHPHARRPAAPPAACSLHYLLALAHGCWVLSHQWVEACLERGGWVSEKQYQARVGGGGWVGTAWRRCFWLCCWTVGQHQPAGRELLDGAMLSPPAAYILPLGPYRCRA